MIALVSMAVLASGEGRDGLAAGLCAFGHQQLTSNQLVGSISLMDVAE